MGKCLLLKTGGGGVDPDELTANQSDVIKGKLVGVNGSDEPVTGTLELNGNASTGDVLLGKTFYSTNPKSKQSGIIKDWRGTPQHIDARRIKNNRFEVAVANGYHGYNWDGNSYEYMEYSEIASTLGLTAAKLAKGQTICGLSGTYTSDASASAAYISSGKTAYINGSKITGTLAMQGGSTTTPSTVNKTIIASPKHVTGNIVVAGSGNLTASNIKKGVNIFGVTGTWSGVVVDPGDLYNKGTFKLANSVYIGSNYTSTAFVENTGQINFRTTSKSTVNVGAYFSPSIDLTGYSTVTMTGHMVYNAKPIYLRLFIGNKSVHWDDSVCKTQVAVPSGDFTLSLNISSINSKEIICFMFTTQAGSSINTTTDLFYIYTCSLR